MLRLRNTTDIPDKLIHIAVAQGIQDGVEIDTIIVKNKRRGKVVGNWGKYYPVHSKYGRCITVTVPRKLVKVHIRRHFGEYYITSRVEFLVKVMAHELRHAYQDQVVGNLQTSYYSNPRPFERDCHEWEFATLMQWRKLVNQMVASNSP
jgi:hypothetical protein